MVTANSIKQKKKLPSIAREVGYHLETEKLPLDDFIIPILHQAHR